jgi:hypothetical protein
MTQKVSIEVAEHAVKQTFDLMEKSGVPESTCQWLAEQHLSALLDNELIDEYTHSCLMIDLQHDGIIKSN